VQVWAGSSTTLGLAEVSYLAKETPLIRAVQGLGFWGGVGLTYAATRDWRRAKGITEKADAFGDLAWGLEGMMEFSPLFSKQLGFFAPIVGTLGGFCQTGIGLRRMWRGFRGKDWSTFKLGMWDVASGGFWLAWDLFGIENPIVVGGFVGTMIGREVYDNRQEIKQSLKRISKRAGKAIKHKTRRTRARLRLMKRRVRHWRQDTLQRLGQRLRRTSRADSTGRFSHPPRRTWGWDTTPGNPSVHDPTPFDRLP
jgi:hypothetical protein